MAVSGVGDCSPETTSGRSRGTGIVPAVPTELTASKKVVRQRMVADMFQRAATVRRAYIRQESSDVGWGLRAHFAISSPSAGNLGTGLLSGPTNIQTRSTSKSSAFGSPQ